MFSDPGATFLTRLLSMVAGAVMALVVVDGARGQDGGGRDAEGTAVELTTVAGGFAAPVFLTEPDDGSGRLFVGAGEGPAVPPSGERPSV